MAKILILSCWDDDFDLHTVKGTPENAYLREYLIRRGIKPIFAFPSTRNDFPPNFLPVKVKLLPVKRKIRIATIPLNYIIQNLSMVRAVSNTKFDLIYSVCNMTSLAGKLLSKKHGVPFAQKFSGLIFFRKYGRLLKWVLDFPTRFSIALNPDKVFVVDDGSGGAAALIEAGLPEDKVVNLPNPLPDKVYGTKPHDPPVVGWIGRFNRLKGIQFLPEIVERVFELQKDVRFYILGFGEYEIKRKLSDSRVTFIPGKTYFEALKFYSELDVYISTNVYANYTMPVLEALANGVPVVAFNVPGTERLIKDGVNGFVVPAFNTDLFAERVVRVLRNRERMMEAAKRAVQGLPGWNERMTLEIEELLKLM